ncbi:MAG TPA: patatin-like phospholipase family protein [Candidatus Limnocylindria bacterium]|nr:patatin-like phospholipase family protein [Candidatus Limnocylindria bacterium]
MSAPDGFRGWLRRLGWSRPPARRALILAGGGVIGGMYEVGALAALDETLPGFRANDFDLYVGSSAGSVVAALMANGVRPRELYTILDEERDDPLNFNRGAVYHKGSFAGATRNVAQFMWAVGKRALTDFRLEWPDLLARSGGDMPAGFFSLAPLEAYLREAFLAKDLSNSFIGTPRPLLVAAVALDRAERVVFGQGDLMDVPISQAIAASSAIPGFFDPYRIAGRDYVDGDVGYTGHADLAVDAGATVLVAINPAVPQSLNEQDGPEIRRGGLYAIMEQAGHISSLNLFNLGLREIKLLHPEVEILVIQPEPKPSPLVGPSMGFEASRAALRYGYRTVKDWLAGPGTVVASRFSLPPP